MREGRLRDAAGPIVNLAAGARAAGRAQCAERRRGRRNGVLAGHPARGGGRRHPVVSRSAAPSAARRRDRGVAFINDSKATNADSAARALVCHERLVWIAGGMQKAGGIEPLHGILSTHRPCAADRSRRTGLRRHPRRACCAVHDRGHVGTGGAGRAGRRPAHRCAGRAVVAGLRELGPVHRLRPARRPLRCLVEALRRAA